MSHISPALYVFWSCLSSCLMVFLVYHLYKFDHFRSLRWGKSTGSGAFKRIMTFAYLISVPAITTYSIGMAAIKYKYGYMEVIGFGIIPTPYMLWSQADQDWIIPLNMVFSIAWALEIVSHLEELCFWLFLTGVGSSQSSWFSSWHFKFWAVGSIAAMIGLPLTTWFNRSDPLMCEAYTFLVGSSGSLFITLVSTRVVAAIPRLVNQVKSAGGEPEVIVRLSTFHDLNIKRYIFRFIFTGSIFVLAVDGVTPHRHVNESELWTDLLAALAGIGMVASSMLTLLIFFPRSIEREAGYKPRGRSASGEAAPPPRSSYYHSTNALAESQSRLIPSRSINYGKGSVPLQTTSYMELEDNSGRGRTQVWEMVTLPEAVAISPSTPGETDRYEVAPFEYSTKQVRTQDKKPPQRPKRDMNPMLMNYTSPINLHEHQPRQRNTSYGYV